MKFSKYHQTHKVIVSLDSKIKCVNCDYCISFGSPCRHVIACNQQNAQIDDFHIRYVKGYNCRAMSDKVEQKFADCSMLAFRGVCSATSIVIDDAEDLNSIAMPLSNDSNCYFSQECSIEIGSQSVKPTSAEFPTQCK